MGKFPDKEERAKEAMRKLGMYNVRIIIAYINGEIETIDAKQWVDNNNNLAITTETYLKIIPHTSMISFSIYPQTDDKESEIVV